MVFGFGIADCIPAETMISIDGAEMILVPAGNLKWELAKQKLIY